MILMDSILLYYFSNIYLKFPIFFILTMYIFIILELELSTSMLNIFLTKKISLFKKIMNFNFMNYIAYVLQVLIEGQWVVVQGGD